MSGFFKSGSIEVHKDTGQTLLSRYQASFCQLRAYFLLQTQMLMST